MFGAIAAAGADRLLYVTPDGHVLVFDAEAGEPAGQFALYPAVPRGLHLAAAAVQRDGVVLLADSRFGVVRRFSLDGTPLRSFGGLATPGIEIEDVPGILHEPCAVLPVGEDLWVACGGDGMEHGVQILDADGHWRASARHPGGEWRRTQGLARLGGEVWVAETLGGAIQRCGLDGTALGPVELHPDLARPLRLAADSYGGALATFAPLGPAEGDADQPPPGVARLDAEGRFLDWAVLPGEVEGKVIGAFDLAVLPDGRFAVADLPFGEPPDVRVQLFSADGRVLHVLMEDRVHLAALQEAWFRSVLAREAADAPTLFDQARIHHFHAGADPEHLEKARGLYRAALDLDPGLLPAHLGLAALLQEGLRQPEAAEQALRLAISAGGPRGELLARIAECHHDRGTSTQPSRQLQAEPSRGRPARRLPPPPRGSRGAGSSRGLARTRMPWLNDRLPSARAEPWRKSRKTPVST